tara:strand:+ start:726 stop:1850 length:1125 start_codon:yes stop_codon:yes gene_type:complete
MTINRKQFSNATSNKSNWKEAANELSTQLNGTMGTLGVLYTSENLSAFLEQMLHELKLNSGITNWIAAGGYGTISSAGEFYGGDTSTALILDIPDSGFKLFSGGAQVGLKLLEKEKTWLEKAVMPLAIVHADPRGSESLEAIESLARETNSFLIGGLTVATGENPHISTEKSESISGVLISPERVEILTGLSQGCTPISDAHTITKSELNIIIEIDERPAFDVFMETIGKEFDDNLRRVAGLIFIAFPVVGSDTADYTVRNLVGLDPENKIIAVSERVSVGDQLLFCRRDNKTAVTDMRRMTENLKERVGDKSIRGGIYVSCAARGPNQFSAPERELDIIFNTLGDFPIAGFFANGEINRDKLYAYTGVLTLFV